MSLYFAYSIAVKSIATAAIVLAASAVTRRAGPFWGAVTAALPVSVGPAYFFLALEHDSGFLEVTALNSAVAGAGAAAFLCTFVFLAFHPMFIGLGLSVVAWLGVLVATQLVDWTPPLVLLLNAATYGAAIWLTRRLRTDAATYGAKTAQSLRDTIVQAFCIASFVAVLVLSSRSLGPELSGFVSVFPISLASVIVLSRGKISCLASAKIAFSALRIMPSYSIAFVAMHLTVGAQGLAIGLVLALSIVVLWAMGVAILAGPHTPVRDE